MAGRQTFFFILFALVQAYDACGGGSSKCSWSTCKAQYTAYSPQPSPGRCISQKSTVRHIYQTHTRDGGCPGSSGCTQKDLSRYLCSCKQIDRCWWASWGPWSGDISTGTCGTQSRYRMGQQSYSYTHQINNCNNVVTKCPRNTDAETRKTCSCRNAKTCTSGQWTGWAPPVQTGSCIVQTRHQDKIPTYTYITSLNNCFGINPKCSDRVIDQRKLCNCPYKECIEGSWTAWELHTWTGNCPQEKRFKKYRSITKYKESFGSCQGVGPTTCPNPMGHYREKVVTCPKLPIPLNGIHKDTACDGVNSACKAICQTSCNKGFVLVGNRYVTCQGDGTWSGKQGRCADNESPKMICPILDPFNNTDNEDFAMVNLPDITATDNTGLQPTITMSHTSPLKVMIGSPIKVTYTATDDSNNAKSCYIKIEAKDIEPPKVLSCPQDKIFQTGKVPYQVFWGEPKFLDNHDGANINVHPSHRNGDFFTRGKHNITYLARDQSFNYVKCTFTIQVELMQCPLYDPPKNGAAMCNIRKDGIIETHICTTSCKKDAWFIKGPGIPIHYDFYVCGEQGQWRGQNTFDPTSVDFFVPIPKGQTPWPDCAVGNTPDGVSMDFQIFGGNCKDNDQVYKLKDDFVNAIKNDMLISNLYCGQASNTNCVLENFVVLCSSKRKRSTGSSGNQVVIKFTFAVRDKSAVNSQSLQIIKLKAMTTLLNQQKGTFLTKVKRTVPTVMKGSSASAYANDAEIACQPGYEFKVVDGHQDVNTRTKCLKCPHGTYYEATTKKCTICNHGYYQENEASLSCKKCPPNMSTYGLTSSDFHECREICKPGTYSSTGLSTCLACPISMYQPLHNSISCIACPLGKVTSRVGSTSIIECSEPGVEILIRSEGCSDPNITSKCGTTSIKVNGKDYSLQKRGMNFVVLDVKTGKFIKAKTFDWHGDYNSCKNTWNWINFIQNNVIVLAAVQDDATSAASHYSCSASLEMIGGKRPFQTEYRSSFALIGYKGSANVDWILQKKSYYGRGPTELKQSIKLLK